MDHCALVEVLYYALCGIPGGERGELKEVPTMMRIIEGYEVFWPLQLKRIDWGQEMFKEEEEIEREREQAASKPDGNVVAGQGGERASSSEQPMDVDDEGKRNVVDATEVTEEKEQEKESGEQPSWVDVSADETLLAK